jgi:hypothetical protein
LSRLAAEDIPSAAPGKPELLIFPEKSGKILRCLVRGIPEAKISIGMTGKEPR